MDNRELELVQMGTKDQQIHTVIKLDLNFELKVNQIMSQYLMPAISKLLLFRNRRAVRGNIDRGTGHRCDERVPEKNARKTSAQGPSWALSPWKTQRIRCYRNEFKLDKDYERLTLYGKTTALYYSYMTERRQPCP